MKVLRILWALALLIVALTPLVFHIAFAGPHLARHHGARMAVTNLVGCVIWLGICWRLWSAPKKGQR